MQQDNMDEAALSLELPGFRFHPTEEELLEFYLKNVIFHDKYFDVIGFLNIYRHDPWELPDLSKVGEREWYFFVARDKKPSNGGRSSRTTPTGYWKATGSERKVVTLSDPKRVIGFRKTLVFYMGRAPRGTKTDWIMNEYRQPDNRSLPKKDIVLCKVYRKATSLKVLEQWASVGEEKTTTARSTTESTPQFQESSYYTTPTSGTANAGPPEEMLKPMINCHVDHAAPWEEDIEMVIMGSSNAAAEISTSLRLPLGQMGLPELHVPKIEDWAQDPLWAQLRSPWFDNIFSQTPTPCANLL